VKEKLFYYHGGARNNGDGTWSCPDCNFTDPDPNLILNAEEGCTMGKPPCSYCGGGRECTLDCEGIGLALSGKHPDLKPGTKVHIAGSTGPTEHES